MNKYTRRNLFAIALMIVGGTFFTTAHNPVGIAYIPEILVALSLIFIVTKLVYGRGLRRTEFAILIIPVILTLYSASAAFLTYGQPIPYGIMEERRLFYLYYYFPLVYFGTKLTDEIKLSEAVQYAALGVTAIGAGLATGLIPTLNEMDAGGALRSSRTSIATGVLTFGFLAAALTRNKRRNLAFAAIILGGLILITLTRQILLAAILGLALTILITATDRKYMSPALLFGGLWLALMAGIVISVGGFNIEILTLFQQLVSDDYLSRSARSITVFYILEDLSFFGNGALSLQWNYGFKSIYHEYFFLADVGTFGTVHRFGIFAVAVVGTALYLIFSRVVSLKRCGSRLYPVALGWAISMVVLLPVGSMFENRGHLLAIFLAICDLVLRARSASVAEVERDDACVTSEQASQLNARTA